MREAEARAGMFREETSVEVVNARHAGCTNPRIAEIVSALVRHLHAFVKDVQLTQEEWETAIGFLTRTGQLCSTERQEFILLSDILGISMLVDTINNRRPAGATENTVIGPFHLEDAPPRQMGDSICLDGKGDTCLFEGRILTMEGSPVAGASIDVWSDNAEGFYDVQQPGIQPPGNNRGVFTTTADGRYSFLGIKPVSYPIPDDGPVGNLLKSLGRHPYRPAHMHFLIAAPGYEKLVTHIFVDGDNYLESDAVFGVKDSLIAKFNRSDSGRATWHCRFDFVLQEG